MPWVDGQWNPVPAERTICRCFTAKVTAHPQSIFRGRGACLNNLCGCWTMGNVSEGSRLLLAGACCLGLEFKLQTWLCGGEDLKEVAPQNSVRLLLLTGTFTESLVMLQAVFWALALTATWIMFSIKQSWWMLFFPCIFSPGKKLSELQPACELPLCPHGWASALLTVPMCGERPGRGSPAIPWAAVLGQCWGLWSLSQPLQELFPCWSLGNFHPRHSCKTFLLHLGNTSKCWVHLMHVALLQLWVNSTHLEEDVSHWESWGEQPVVLEIDTPAPAPRAGW